MSPVLPREERDAIRALRQKYDRVLDGRATPETAEIALELADAMVEKVPALLDALDAAEAENERLRGDATDLERLADTYTTEGTVIVLNKILNLRAERDAARAEVAALRGRIDHIVDRYGDAHDARNCAVLHDLRALAADEGERTGR